MSDLSAELPHAVANAVQTFLAWLPQQIKAHSKKGAPVVNFDGSAGKRTLV
jgi:hypothetical protein